MHLNITIRVLPGMRTLDFSIHCIPETLHISRHPSGSGYEIQIDDSAHSKRLWFACEIIEIGFGAERAPGKVSPMVSP